MKKIYERGKMRKMRNIFINIYRYKIILILSFNMNKEEIYKCSFCKYISNKKFNLNRHEVNKHSKEILKNDICTPNISYSQQNNNQIERNNNQIEQNNNPMNQNNNLNNSQENDNDNDNKCQNFCCKKCNKVYLTKKNLINHESKCKGVDILTCPRCMISFTRQQAKSRHIKRNNCKPRSIIHARIPNIQNINNTTNNNTTNNNTTNNIINNNNIININNYGNERLDYLNYDKYLSIFKKNYDIPSALTEEIHFNTDFPENNNILYNDKTSVLIKSNNNYLEKDTKLFVEELINNKSKIIQKFAHNNKSNICESMSCALYDEIIELLLKLIVKEPISQYNKQTKKIMDLIRNNKV